MVSIAVAAERTRGQARMAHWRLAWAQFLLMAAAVSALNGIFAGSGWWLLGLVVAAVVLTAQAALRRLGVPRAAVPFAGLGVVTVLMTGMFGAGTGLVWIVPTPATIERFVALGQQAAVAVGQQAVPAQERPELMFLLAGGTAIAALAMDTLAVSARAPAACGLIVFGILVVPAVLLADGISPLWLVACAAAYVFLLRAGTIARSGGIARPALSFAVAASSIVIALVVSTTAPAFTGSGSLGFGSGMSVGYGVSPLIDLGKDLRRPVSMPVMRYNTTSPDGEYLKLLSLDRFSGATWTHGRASMKQLDNGSDLSRPAGLSSAVKTTEITTRINTGNVQSPWLPAPYPPSTVTGLTGDWAYDASDLSISSRQSNASNRSYRVTSLEPQPTPQQLAGSSGYPAEIQKDLALPDEKIPKIIAKTAERVTADAPDNYRKAVALQDYFRNTDFSYSVQAPVEEGYDGDGLEVIATFLKKKAGYCVHFASAMAIMARVLGIPSRVAVGYLPGTRTGQFVGDRVTYQVDSDDLHAWPELYFPNVGWVRFEPTVGLGVVPSYSEPIVAPDASGSSLEPAAPDSSTSTPVPTTSSEALAPTTPNTPASGGFEAIAIVLIAAAVCLVPAAVRLLRRRLRRGRMRRGRSPAANAWRELADTLRDLGRPAPPTDSPRALAGRLTDLEGAPANALRRLVAAVERERYAPPSGSPPAAGRGLDDDLLVVLAALRSRATVPVRLKAALLPASLASAGRLGPAVGHTA